MKNINSLARELNGYRLIYLPDHPRAMKNDNWNGYVYEHIVVAEKYHGKIQEGEEVHHLDGNRRNNRHNNLLVLKKAQHGRLHAWLNAGAPGIESFRENGENSVKANGNPNPTFCNICEVTLQDKQEHYCSEACRGMANRKVERPSKSQLLADITTMSMVKVGLKYGVSDNAIRKWMKTFGLPKPTLSRAKDTSLEGSETTGEVQSS